MLLDTPPIIWIAVAVILLAAEMLTGTFYLLVMGIAAAAGALAAWGGCPLQLQIVLALMIAAAGAFIVFRWHKKHDRKDDASGNNLDIGQTVVWQGTYPDGSWKVHYRGAQWQARPFRPDVDPSKPLLIADTSGNTLIVDNQANGRPPAKPKEK